jgi:hypothetical protein
MEQARRSALAHHVHRTAPMGPRVLINGIWYNSVSSEPGAGHFRGWNKQGLLLRNSIRMESFLCFKNILVQSDGKMP